MFDKRLGYCSSVSSSPSTQFSPPAFSTYHVTQRSLQCMFTGEIVRIDLAPSVDGYVGTSWRDGIILVEANLPPTRVM